jgi:hypothetical protein
MATQWYTAISETVYIIVEICRNVLFPPPVHCNQADRLELCDVVTSSIKFLHPQISSLYQAVRMVLLAASVTLPYELKCVMSARSLVRGLSNLVIPRPPSKIIYINLQDRLPRHLCRGGNIAVMHAVADLYQAVRCQQEPQ